MPFLRGGDHALVRQDIGSSAELEPSLSPDLWTVYHKAVLSNSELVSRLKLISLIY